MTKFALIFVAAVAAGGAMAAYGPAPDIVLIEGAQSAVGATLEI